MTKPRRLALALLLPSLVALLAGCSGTAGSSNKHLTLVACSTPQQAFAALISGFQATPREGKGASFSQSYGPSGDQSRAVARLPDPRVFA